MLYTNTGVCITVLQKSNCLFWIYHLAVVSANGGQLHQKWIKSEAHISVVPKVLYIGLYKVMSTIVPW